MQRATPGGDLPAPSAAPAAEPNRERRESDRLAQENQALVEVRDRLSAELERWRVRVAAMESTRAWRLRAWLLRWRHGRRQ
jgi:hypothetical protein